MPATQGTSQMFKAILPAAFLLASTAAAQGACTQADIGGNMDGLFHRAGRYRPVGLGELRTGHRPDGRDSFTKPPPPAQQPKHSAGAGGPLKLLSRAPGAPYKGSLLPIVLRGRFDGPDPLFDLVAGQAVGNRRRRARRRRQCLHVLNGEDEVISRPKLPSQLRLRSAAASQKERARTSFAVGRHFVVTLSTWHTRI